MAWAERGQFLLRIEDIDQSRSRAKWEEQIFDDLTWLGLKWETPVMRQSNRLPRYRQALEIADPAGSSSIPVPANGRTSRLPPERRRKAFRSSGPMAASIPEPAAISALSEASADRRLTAEHAQSTGRDRSALVSRKPGRRMLAHIRCNPTTFSVRLAISFLCAKIWAVPTTCPSLSMTPISKSLMLCGVRICSKPREIHVLLQSLLNLPTPIYHHHHLIRDEDGKRLAKRDDARAIALCREQGASVADIRKMVGL